VLRVAFVLRSTEVHPEFFGLSVHGSQHLDRGFQSRGGALYFVLSVESEATRDAVHAPETQSTDPVAALHPVAFHAPGRNPAPGHSPRTRPQTTHHAAALHPAADHAPGHSPGTHPQRDARTLLATIRSERTQVNNKHLHRTNPVRLAPARRV